MACRAEAAKQQRLVGPGRLERPTSRLSGVRSNHLSYEPVVTNPVETQVWDQSETPANAGICSAIDGKEGKRRRRSVIWLSSEVDRGKASIVADFGPIRFLTSES